MLNLLPFRLRPSTTTSPIFPAYNTRGYQINENLNIAPFDIPSQYISSNPQISWTDSSYNSDYQNQYRQKNPYQTNPTANPYQTSSTTNPYQTSPTIIKSTVAPSKQITTKIPTNTPTKAPQTTPQTNNNNGFNNNQNPPSNNNNNSNSGNNNINANSNTNNKQPLTGSTTKKWVSRIHLIYLNSETPTNKRNLQ